MINTFYLDAESAEAYGLIMLAPPDHVVAERDIERKEVPGRSGDVIIDNGRYKNVTVKFTGIVMVVLPPVLPPPLDWDAQSCQI